MNQTKSAFRVGGYYRDATGDVVWLWGGASNGRALAALWTGNGWHKYHTPFDLGTGFYSNGDNEGMNLIPGELHQVNGEWIPKESAEVHSPMIAAAPEEKLASVKVCEEPKREPLDWNKPTSIDRFPGFISTTSVAWDELSKPEASHSHPLQKMAEGKEGFGSAALLKVR